MVATQICLLPCTVCLQCNLAQVQEKKKYNYSADLFFFLSVLAAQMSANANLSKNANN